MPNLTLTIDEDTLRAARIRALEQGTSVNAVVRAYLREFAGRRGGRDAMRSFLEDSEHWRASSGPGGRGWTRDELYDPPGRPPGK